MATRIKFRQKSFADIWKKVGVGLSAAGLGVSATNLAVNTARHTDSKKYQKQQLEAMNNLTNSIQGLDKRLEKQPINQPIEKKKRRSIFKFR